MSDSRILVGLAQIAPVWLNRESTTEKLLEWIESAAAKGCRLVVFGEALLPGYPFWVERTDGAKFNSSLQKSLYSHYVSQSVCIEDGDLDAVCALAKARRISIYLGCMERATDRGGHSLYCSLVYIDAEGLVQSVHRKLMPTYEERLVWASGDGHGLRTHALGPFTVGGLNCWENWLPLARSALYGQGENLHVAVWPGNVNNTEDITRFIARESRSFVVSVGGLMRRSDISGSLPHGEELLKAADELMANGGSCVAGPDGQWLLPPQAGDEALYTVELDLRRVYEERQNLDVVGHYSRPDVTQLQVDRTRQSTIKLQDD